MKTSLFTLLFILSMGLMQGQGLENIIVERYYVSNADDSLATDAISAAPGALPAGSVTYRIYADMAPGYNFQAGFGVTTHELRFETTTSFFNNEDRGAAQPNYSKNLARTNTVMIDSWLSAGSGCLNNFGVLKSDDDGVATVVNNNVPPVLQNNDTSAGIPLTVQDGLLAGTPIAVTFVPTPPPVFDNTQYGNLFSTRNFSWAALGGAVGPDTTNKVLIAQMTTNGIFSFKLNLQLGGPGAAVEQYVADSATGTEIQLNALAQTFYPVAPVGIRDVNTTTAQFAIYPNPTSENLTVEIEASQKNSSATLVVVDVLGKERMKKNILITGGKQSVQVDVSSLARGYYLARLYTETGLQVKQFIKN